MKWLKKLVLGVVVSSAIVTSVSTVSLAEDTNVNYRSDSEEYAKIAALRSITGYLDYSDYTYNDWMSNRGEMMHGVEKIYPVENGVIQIPDELKATKLHGSYAISNGADREHLHLGFIQDSNGDNYYLTQTGSHGEMGFAVTFVPIKWDAAVSSGGEYFTTYGEAEAWAYEQLAKGNLSALYNGGGIYNDYVYFITSDNPETCYIVDNNNNKIFGQSAHDKHYSPPNGFNEWHVSDSYEITDTVKILVNGEWKTINNNSHRDSSYLAYGNNVFWIGSVMHNGYNNYQVKLLDYIEKAHNDGTSNAICSKPLMVSEGMAFTDYYQWRGTDIAENIFREHNSLMRQFVCGYFNQYVENGVVGQIVHQSDYLAFEMMFQLWAEAMKTTYQGQGMAQHADRMFTKFTENGNADMSEEYYVAIVYSLIGYSELNKDPAGNYIDYSRTVYLGDYANCLAYIFDEDGKVDSKEVSGIWSDNKNTYILNQTNLYNNYIKGKTITGFGSSETAKKKSFEIKNDLFNFGVTPGLAVRWNDNYYVPFVSTSDRAGETWTTSATVRNPISFIVRNRSNDTDTEGKVSLAEVCDLSNYISNPTGINILSQLNDRTKVKKQVIQNRLFLDDNLSINLAYLWKLYSINKRNVDYDNNGLIDTAPMFTDYSSFVDEYIGQDALRDKPFCLVTRATAPDDLFNAHATVENEDGATVILNNYNNLTDKFFILDIASAKEGGSGFMPSSEDYLLLRDFEKNCLEMEYIASGKVGSAYSFSTIQADGSETEKIMWGRGIMAYKSNSDSAGGFGTLRFTNDKEFVNQLAGIVDTDSDGNTSDENWLPFGVTVAAKPNYVPNDYLISKEAFEKKVRQSNADDVTKNYPYMIVMSLTFNDNYVGTNIPTCVDATSVPFVPVGANINDYMFASPGYAGYQSFNSPLYDIYYPDSSGTLKGTVSGHTGPTISAYKAGGSVKAPALAQTPATYNCNDNNTYAIGFRVNNAKAGELLRNNTWMAFHLSVDPTADIYIPKQTIDIGVTIQYYVVRDDNLDGVFSSDEVTNMYNFGEHTRSAVHGSVKVNKLQQSKWYKKVPVSELDAYGLITANTPIKEYHDNANTNVYTTAATWDVLAGIPSTENVCVITGGDAYSFSMQGIYIADGYRISNANANTGNANDPNAGKGQDLSNPHAVSWALDRTIQINTVIKDSWSSNVACSLSCKEGEHSVFSKSQDVSPAMPSNVLTGNGTQSSVTWTCATCGATGSYTYSPGSNAQKCSGGSVGNPCSHGKTGSCGQEISPATQGSWSGGHTCSWSATFNCSTGTITTSGCSVASSTIIPAASNPNKQRATMTAATFKCGTKTWSADSTVTDTTIIDEGYTTGTGCTCSGNTNAYHHDKDVVHTYYVKERVDYFEAKQIENWLIMNLGYIIIAENLDNGAGYGFNDIYNLGAKTGIIPGTGITSSANVWRTTSEANTTDYLGRVWFTVFNHNNDDKLTNLGITPAYRSLHTTVSTDTQNIYGRYYLGDTLVTLTAYADSKEVGTASPDYSVTNWWRQHNWTLNTSAGKDAAGTDTPGTEKASTSSGTIDWWSISKASKGDAMTDTELLYQSLYMVNKWQSVHDTTYYCLGISDIATIQFNGTNGLDNSGMYYELISLNQDIMCDVYVVPMGLRLYDFDFTANTETHYRTHFSGNAYGEGSALADDSAYVDLADLTKGTGEDGIYTGQYQLGYVPNDDEGDKGLNAQSDVDKKDYLRTMYISHLNQKEGVCFGTEGNSILNLLSDPTIISDSLGWADTNHRRRVNFAGIRRKFIAFDTTPVDANFDAVFDIFSKMSDDVSSTVGVTHDRYSNASLNKFGIFQTRTILNYTNTTNWKEKINSEDEISSMIKDIKHSGYYADYYYPSMIDKANGVKNSVQYGYNNTIPYQNGSGYGSVCDGDINIILYGCPLVVTNLTLEPGTPNGIYGGSMCVLNTYSAMSWNAELETDSGREDCKNIVSEMGLKSGNSLNHSDMWPSVQIMCSYYDGYESQLQDKLEAEGNEIGVKHNSSLPLQGGGSKMFTEMTDSDNVLFESGTFDYVFWFRNLEPQYIGQSSFTIPWSKVKEAQRSPINDILIHTPISNENCMVISNEVGHLFGESYDWFKDESKEDMRVTDGVNPYVVSGNEFYIWYSDIGNFTANEFNQYPLKNVSAKPYWSKIDLEGATREIIETPVSPNVPVIPLKEYGKATWDWPANPTVNETNVGYTGSLNTSRWVDTRNVKFPYPVSYQAIDEDGNIYDKVAAAGEWVDLSTVCVVAPSYDFDKVNEGVRLGNSGINGENYGARFLTCLGIDLTNNYGIWKPDMSKFTYTNAAGKINVSEEAYNTLAKMDYGCLYKFRCLSSAYEANGADVQFCTIAINAPEADTDDFVGYKNDTSDDFCKGPFEEGTTPVGQSPLVALWGYETPVTADYDDIVDTGTANNNIKRDADYFKASSKITNNFTIDVVGRIGNISIVDVGDFRYSNLFKYPTKDGAWLISNVIRKVEPTAQRTIGTAVHEILGEKTSEYGYATFSYTSYNHTSANYNAVDNYNGYYGKATKTSGKGDDFVLPLTPANNNIDDYKTEPVRLGYKAYFDIETVGNYYGINNTRYQGTGADTRSQYLDIIPHYVLYDYSKGEYVTDLEFWYGSEGSRKICYDTDASGNVNPVYTALDMNVSLYTSADDLKRYPTDALEKSLTKETLDFMKLTEIDNSSPIRKTGSIFDTEGSSIYIGNTSLIRLDQYSRSFIGSPYLYNAMKGLNVPYSNNFINSITQNQVGNLSVNEWNIGEDNDGKL